MFGRVFGWFFGKPLAKSTNSVVQPAPIPVKPTPYYEQYRSRKRSLPNTFTARDWQRALDYWGHCCAVCGRPRGLWHTLSQDHWIPLTHPDCPGTTPSNMLPLCCGTDGCNNSKGSKHPRVWLKEKFGTRRATRKWAEIEAYFAFVREVTGDYSDVDVTPCPDCTHPLDYNEEYNVWQCAQCGSEWREKTH
jgi:ribosomal protein L37AE/L43A